MTVITIMSTAIIAKGMIIEVNYELKNYRVMIEKDFWNK